MEIRSEQIGKFSYLGGNVWKRGGQGALSVRIFSKDVQLYVYDSMFIFIWQYVKLYEKSI